MSRIADRRRRHRQRASSAPSTSRRSVASASRCAASSAARPERGAARAERARGRRGVRHRSRTLLADPASRSSTSPRRTTSTSRRPRPILDAGRHVVCEKPLAMTADGVRRARRARRAQRQGQRRQLQHPLLPAQPARPRGRRRRRARRGPARHRPLLPGLAAARDRLELAARAGSRRGAPRGRRHRLALARPDRPSSPGSASARSWPTWRRSSRSATSRRGPVETFSTERAAETVDARRSRPRTSRRSCCGSRTGRADRSPSARSAPAQELAPVRDRRLRAAACWDSEQPDQLWIGHRDRPNEILIATRR